MSFVEILKQGYKYFAAGNIEATIAQWQPDIIWEVCIGFPFVEEDGKYVGVKTVIQEIFAKIQEH